MPTWKANAFVTTVSVLPLLVYGALPRIPRTTILGINIPWSPLAILAYIGLLSGYTWPFFTHPLRHLPFPSSTSWLLGDAILGPSRPVHEVFLQWTKQIPNDGIVAFTGFFHREVTLLLTTPDAVKEVLNDKAYDYVKPAQISDFLRLIIGNGLITSEGSEHKRQRKVVAPVFHGNYLKNLLPLFWTKSMQLTEVVRLKTSNNDHGTGQSRGEGVVEIQALAARTTLDIIGLGSVGRDFDTLETDDNQLAKDFSALLDLSNKSLFSYYAAMLIFGQKIAKIILRKGHKIFSTTTASLRSSSNTIVAEKRNLLEQKSGTQYDIVSLLLQSALPFSETDLTDQLLTFLLAGHETTSSALTWVCYVLSIHKETQDQLRDELRKQVCKDPDPSSLDSVDLEALVSLPFLNAVCNETLRLFSPVPCISRASARPTTIGAVSIPAGTAINICPWVMNRLPSLWGDDAEEFKPDRWMGEGCAYTGGASTFSFLTFSHGPRNCIGQGFARNELKCLVAALILRFEMELADKDYVPVSNAIFTIKPRDGMPLLMREL